MAIKKNREKESTEALFVSRLLHWNQHENFRAMPWKGEKDPYKIWLSEIILQQTRVEQGLQYYQNFIRSFPDIHALARAPEEKVFKLWEGLGYYSRCRNLIHSARFISTALGGVFPRRYEDILDLKGVGPYTAAAIASFAYNHPHAVLDGNVFRVLARILDMDTPIDSVRGKKEFAAAAQRMLPMKRAGEYNQAVMDFGAVICKPAPLCGSCFFQSHCRAFHHGTQQLLPVKEKRLALKKRWLNYFIIRCGEEIALQQREEKDIWQHLFQFVLIETGKEYKVAELLLLLEKQHGIAGPLLADAFQKSQRLSHQHIHFHFLILEVAKKQKMKGYRWIKLHALQDLAFPKALQQVVQNYLS